MPLSLKTMTNAASRLVRDQLNQILEQLQPIAILSARSPEPQGKTRRVRMRVRGLYHADGYRWHLVSKVQQQLPMLKSIGTNPSTGSMLLEFHHPFPLAQAVEAVRLAVCSAIYQRIIGEPYPPLETLQHWHALSADEVLRLIDSDKSRGLDDEEIVRRTNYYGANTLLSADADTGNLSLFLQQLSSLPVLVLLGAGLVSIASSSFLDGGIILGVVAVNAVIGYLTDERAQRTLRSLQHLPRDGVRVVRQGSKGTVASESLVPGDIVMLRPGLVPADIRILASKDLYVDEALLTGESVPQEKSAKAISSEHSIPLRCPSNMLYMGSELNAGSGMGVVIATGMATELGRIKLLAEQHQKPETVMQRDLREITSTMVWGSLLACGGIVAIGIVRGQKFAALLRSAVALAIAAVPEGLPAVGTTTLAYGVEKLRQNNIFARNLRSIEALGSVQTICWDKTGTITWNKMVVEQLCLGELHWQRGAAGGQIALCDILLEVAALCHNVHIDSESEPEEWMGSGTEKALINLAREHGSNISAIMAANPLLRTEQRTSTRHYMRTHHQRSRDGSTWTACKGSPLQVLATCSRWLRCSDNAGQRVYSVEAISPEQRRRFQQQNQRLAQAALRVLALAYRDDDDHVEGYVWLGLAGLKDPPREGIKDLMQKFHRAGIHLMMVTGDQQETARAIAREISLSGNGELHSCTGEEWAAQNRSPGEESTQQPAPRMHVISETTPQQKLEIIQALQRSAEVVAMVGDGINDAPALRAADLGISLMNNAANAAKECADVVVDDREVENIYHALTYGRTVRHNLRKAISYLCATNTSEIIVMLCGHLSGMGAPLHPLQLLWINVMTDIFPSLAFALAPPEPDIMTRPPQERGNPLLNGENKREVLRQGLVMSGSALLPFGYFQARFGDPLRSSTAAFCALSSTQLLHALLPPGLDSVGVKEEGLEASRASIAQEGSYVGIAAVGGLALLGAGIYLPFLRRSLGTSMLSLADVITLMPVVAGTLLVNRLIIKKNLRLPLVFPQRAVIH